MNPDDLTILFVSAWPRSDEDVDDQESESNLSYPILEKNYDKKKYLILNFVNELHGLFGYNVPFDDVQHYVIKSENLKQVWFHNVRTLLINWSVFLNQGLKCTFSEFVLII